MFFIVTQKKKKNYSYRDLPSIFYLKVSQTNHEA